MNAIGVPNIIATNVGANRPKAAARRPQKIPAVYWRARSPDAVSNAFVGPVRHVDIHPTAAFTRENTPQAIVAVPIGG